MELKFSARFLSTASLKEQYSGKWTWQLISFCQNSIAVLGPVQKAVKHP
ncbi:MAG TPA: hypothetical protein VK469_06770 [Candidatus Kapabacteria bacterium]|nr:hypothetical protein [Candidatus Kapabacteria bacterium]